MELPVDFVTLMREQLGDEAAERLFEGLKSEPSVSVRFNDAKLNTVLPEFVAQLPKGDEIPWCPGAYWLSERPSFTFDPLFHAGVYYVQESSSMYLAEVLRQYMPAGDIAALDLCAAPGGKSTLLRSQLTANSLLVSNEPMRQRAQVLAENMTKWGHPNTIVTQNFPADFSHLTDIFQLIVADVPCSGEGMFRKDEGAIRDWSLENVDTCWRRQRDIVETIWPTLCDGGLFIYSTCTFNRYEDEDNVQWIAKTLGAEVLEQRHFFPGIDRGEGFFIAALRKGTASIEEQESSSHVALAKKIARTLHVLHDGTQMQKDTHAWVMSTTYQRGSYPEVEVDHATAIAYLRREALRIDAPRGLVVVTYQGVPLGLAKSVGNRLNNLYPQEWRIRTTYNPS